MNKIVLVVFILLLLCFPVNAKTVYLTNQDDSTLLQKAVDYINGKVEDQLLTIVETAIADIIVSFMKPSLEQSVPLGVCDHEQSPISVVYLQKLPSKKKYLVLIHELVHALGVPHMWNKKSIMYWDASKSGKELMDEDIELIKCLNRKELGYELVKIKRGI